VTPERILGIDPGTRATGWGVVERRPADPGLRMVAYGTLRPPVKATPAGRLAFIHAGLLEVLTAHEPHAVAVEEAYFGQNVRSAIRLAEARAVCLLAAEQRGLGVHELPPALVKKTVTGHGRSSKEGVRRAVLLHLGMASAERPPAYDASDALAGAICALRRLEGAGLIRDVPLGRRGRRGSRRWTAEDVARIRGEAEA
jgi:crossover junction endodeoxyribonuclease RuvC